MAGRASTSRSTGAAPANHLRLVHLDAKGKAMAVTPTYSLRRQRNLIRALLLALAAAAWALLIRQAAHRGMAAAMSPTMGMSAAFWLSIWVAMMVAIMFPTAAPMMLMFAQVHAAKRQRQQPFVPTWMFVSPYLLVWAVTGVLASGAAVGGVRLASRHIGVM